MHWIATGAQGNDFFPSTMPLFIARVLLKFITFSVSVMFRLIFFWISKKNITKIASTALMSWSGLHFFLNGGYKKRPRPLFAHPHPHPNPPFFNNPLSFRSSPPPSGYTGRLLLQYLRDTYATGPPPDFTFAVAGPARVPDPYGRINSGTKM